MPLKKVMCQTALIPNGRALSLWVAALVLLAASADSGIDAGQTLKAVLAEAGGRGGGAARMAQGSVPDAALIEKVIAKLG